jgi:uncharacterized pyridoxal phosphate-containing UPF0001 family protein
VTGARDDLVARVTRNLDAVRERIARADRDPDTVDVLAVVKGHGHDVVLAAVGAGLSHLGENFADELVAHHDALAHHDVLARDDVEWHYLGALQRNKLGRLAGRVAVYETLADSLDAERAAERAAAARCYVQVDVAGTPGRAGCRPGTEGAVVAAARDHGLDVLGLMCVASPDPTLAAAEFGWLRGAADALGLHGCSMGMSDDLELACRAGATQVRLGTALFGDRPTQAPRGLA